MRTKNSEYLDCSPLDHLARSRTSIASEASGECGILDAFPLPDGIEQHSGRTLIHQSSSDKDVTLDNNSSSTSVLSRPSCPDKYLVQQHNGCVTLPDVSNPIKKDIETRDEGLLELPISFSPQPISQRRLERYGHLYGNSFSSMDIGERKLCCGNTRCNSPEKLALKFASEHAMQHGQHSESINKEVSPPHVSRSHSVSRSWDAGHGKFSFPQPGFGFKSLTSAEEHVKEGSLALSHGNTLIASQHWTRAASAPWVSSSAQLLLAIGEIENWFDNLIHTAFYVADQSNLPSAEELKQVAEPIMPRVVSGLAEYASSLKSKQFDLEALAVYELAGKLGSSDALVSAAQMYYKGSRRIKRDVNMSQRLYKRAVQKQ